MPVKKQQDNTIVLLVRDKSDLKATIENRIQIGLDICERQISSAEDNDQMWKDFIDWNTLNEEIVRQAFNNPKNIYVDEYKYKPGISLDTFYGNYRQKTFQEEVQENKDVIKYQVRKLKWFFEKIDVLQVAENIAKSDPSKNQFSALILVLNRFHKVAQAIRDRHSDKETIIIQNEYDVQDLLNGLLQINFEDVRKEDFSPSHAGANSRLDFVLKKEKIILEVKMTSEQSTIDKLGRELLVDIGRYKEYPDCNDLVIFIYDRGDLIRNKTGFINDLQKQSTSKLRVTVVINPA